jgi:predicted DNA-binding protein (MmcQ/YjbR family)
VHFSSKRLNCFPFDYDNIMPPAEDRRLVRLTKICRALPETSRVLSGDHAGFKVWKKTFSYFLNNHHGDGIVGVTFKAAPGDNAKLIALDPTRFYLPAYIGPRGWVGLRLDVGKVDWDEVADFVGESYRLVAPARLVALVNARATESWHEEG